VGNIVGTAILAAMSLGMGTVFCSPIISMVGGIAAARLVTTSSTDQPFINSVLFWLAAVAGVTTVTKWKALGSTGMRMLIGFITAAATIGAIVTTSAATQQGGTKQFECQSGYVCRDGPVIGSASNAGTCFSKCCGKTRDVVVKTAVHDRTWNPITGTEHRLRVQWPNGILAEKKKWDPLKSANNGYYMQGSPAPYSPRLNDSTHTYMWVDFGDGCTSVGTPDLSSPTVWDHTMPTYYQGEYGVSVTDTQDYPKMPGKRNTSAGDVGFWDNEPTRNFLEQYCGIGTVGNTASLKRLFANQLSYSSQNQCDAVPCTGVDPTGDSTLMSFDATLPIKTGDMSEFYIDPDFGSKAHCCHGYYRTSYGTCKLLPQHTRGVNACIYNPNNTSLCEAPTPGEQEFVFDPN